VAETGFNSSPVTKGALFRAVKPLEAMERERFGAPGPAPGAT
jgi:hypothetical protein